MSVYPKEIAAAFCALLTSSQAGDVAVLYDPNPTTTLVDQGFQNLSSEFSNQDGFYSVGADTTDFDSGPLDRQIATFFTHGLFTGNTLHPEAQVLDRSVGFRISIDLAIDSETHDPVIDLDGDGILDSAGFSIAIVSSDLRGIGLNFWEDRIWASEDDSSPGEVLFSQAEGIAQSPAAMATLRRYDLEILGNAYRLRADGVTLLTGLLRDYSNFPGRTVEGVGVLNNFDKPNSITIGDPVSVAQSTARIGEITTETPHLPAPDVSPTFSIAFDLSGAVQLTWDSIPGETYSLQSGSDLVSFSEFDNITTTSFTSNFTDPRPVTDRQFYKIVSSP